MKTSYITTDLDLESDEDLQRLANAVPSEIIVHFCGKADGLYRAVFGLSINDSSEDDAANIYCSFAESLAEPEKSIWASCTRIAFNFGYEAGSNPSTWRSTISQSTLARIADLGGEATVTIYKHAERVDA